MKNLYFFGMKYLCSLLLLLCFISCKEQKAAPVTTVSRPALINKDSNILKNEFSNPYEPVDVSPMDMSYMPNDYPIMKMNHETTKLPVARVIYSRPQKQGRKIFGELIKYGELWRLGANEATEIELFQPITIQNKTIAPGRYTLYCIPQQNKWTIVFNTNLDSWGLKPDPKKDLYKFDTPVQVKDQSIEFFTMVFEKKDYGADLVMAWDEVEARLPIHYTEK